LAYADAFEDPCLAETLARNPNMDRVFRRNARHPFALPALVDIRDSVSAI
jgi:hypothetical protein